MVFESNLLDLFTICPSCFGSSRGTKNKVLGTMVEILRVCSDCGYTSRWRSLPLIRNMPAGNLALSAAILLSGSQAAKSLRMLDILGLASISSSTFFRHQSSYLQPAIMEVYNQQQKELIADLVRRGGDLVLCGDGRSDSPGHCAKYGTYTVIEARVNKVLDTQVVQACISIVWSKFIKMIPVCV